MVKYQTKVGDVWDRIAYEQLGSCKYVDKLIDANRDKIETFIFGAGEELTIPKVDKSVKAVLPPWRT